MKFMQRSLVALIVTLLGLQAYLLTYERPHYIYSLAKYNATPLIKLYNQLGIALNNFHYHDNGRPNRDLVNPLFLALQYNDIDTFRALINTGLDPLIINPTTHAGPRAVILSLIFAGQISKEQAFALPKIGEQIRQDYLFATDTSLLKKIDHMHFPPLLGSNPYASAYSDGYNSSFILHDNRYITAYRFSLLLNHDKRTEIEDHLALGYYSNATAFNFQESHTILTVAEQGNQYYTGVYDPRLFEYKKQLYIIFDKPIPIIASVRANPRKTLKRGMYIAKLNADRTGKLRPEEPLFLYTANQEAVEKNWGPLIHKGKLYFIYSLSPELIVLEANLATGECTEVSRTKNTVSPAGYGHIRGGTQYIPIDDNNYITMAHATVFTTQSAGKQGQKRAYFLMPHIISVVNNKFIVSHGVQSPILANITPRNHDYYAQVIFPGGLIDKDGEYQVLAGVNDQEAYLITLDKLKLLDLLGFAK